MENTSTIGAVLLIEDNPAHQMIIKRALKDFTTSLKVASTFQEAKELISVEGFHPEIVLTDLRLPDSDGGDTVRAVKALIPSSPLIVLTSSSELVDAVAALQVGARDFLVKNFDGEFENLLQIALMRVSSEERLKREKDLLFKESYVLRAAVELGVDPVLVMNSEGSTYFANSAFKSLLSENSVETLKEYFARFPARKPFEFASFEQSIRALPPGGSWQTQFIPLSDDALAFDISVTCVAFSETESFHVIWLKDITDSVRQEKFQRDLISTTTHDLKNPLGAISVSAELLEKYSGDKERVEKIALRIGSASQSALTLVEEFLSARKIHDGSLILRPSVDTVVTEVIQEQIDSFDAQCRSRNITVHYNRPEELLKWKVDRLAFSRVIGNLISNAIKYNKPGGEITVNLSNTAENLTVEVSDTGGGIDGSEISSIFERYGRLSKHSQISGTGLGLFVVRGIVSAHSGTIDVKSQIDKGTTFRIVLPKDPPVNERGEIVVIAF